jgi:hypothetical protein
MFARLTFSLSFYNGKGDEMAGIWFERDGLLSKAKKVCPICGKHIGNGKRTIAESLD